MALRSAVLRLGEMRSEWKPAGLLDSRVMSQSRNQEQSRYLSETETTLHREQARHKDLQAAMAVSQLDAALRFRTHAPEFP